MKKALVMTFVLVLGLGLTVSAAPFSGSWKTTIGVDPSETVFADFFTKLDSTLEVDYIFGGWTFGADSTFALTGFTNQEFTAEGVLGAFSFESTMIFEPARVTVKDYEALSATAAPAGVGSAALTQTPSAAISTYLCDTWTYTATTAPAFKKWTAEGSVSIAGVNLGALFILDRSNFNLSLVDYIFKLDKSQTDAVTLASYPNGAGWKFTVSGTFGGATLTSYTYFNLSESDVRALRCPEVGKRGVYHISSDGCGVAFTEEYLMLEGVGFGCVELDAAAKITCSGFSKAVVVLSDISICSWLNLDFGLIFTTSSKAVDLCLDLDCIGVKNFDCMMVELGFGNTDFVTTADATTGGFKLDSIYVHGVSLEYTWNGVTFTSMTEFDIYSDLFSAASAAGTEKWKVLNSAAMTAFLIPYGGYSSYTAAAAAACCDGSATSEDCTLTDTDAGYYEVKCLATYRYKLWEKFEVDVDGDACCGGLMDITVATYFGDKQKLAYVAYDIIQDGATAPGALTYLVQDATTDTATATTAKTTAVCYDTVTFKYGYKDTGVATDVQLFNWALTEVDLSFGVGSNVTLTSGFDVSAFGWEALEFGFEFTF